MRKIPFLVASLLAVAMPLAAQSHALTISGRGGGFSALTNLNDGSNASDFKTGYNLGGGVGLQVHRNVTLRGDFTFARAKFRDAGVTTDDHFNKFFYTAAIQLQHPTSSGFMPYVFVGGGGVTIKEKGAPNGQNVEKTKGAGVGGIRLAYQVPRSRWSIFAEGTGYLYKVNNLSGTLAGFDKTQFDAAWSGGVSYAIGL